MSKKYNIENLTPFEPEGEKALSKKPLQLRVEQEIYDTVMSLPKQKRLKLLRQWIKDGVESLDNDNIKAS
ncbi:MAG: hypothetical protein Kow0049_06770 [Stanieria sp.]|uniref:Uncharacterized protein n=1 Tax=Stanieria cyanosphaera (strain ATCC 29371 / PCC 7437) TaxID=111780 RepID=K9XSF3_STAC7|nr:hypothetical protein [Stanieria cyanosphaera]AFZ35530.1 hypothetical protein Sta7437_1976 [Stanieria cyanosphaera PCC 7437]